MKRASVIVLVALLALMAIGPIGPASAAGPQRVAPKVAIIVGPVGAKTDSYRKLGNEAAAAALKFTPNVVRVFSPDATWPAVKKALNGASIVVYLGHGNGWPSRYRNELTPTTQNGFGLNPHAGAGDTHQYFGEGRISKEIELAKDAVVVLSHLCYASGNSEPGLPEGTLEMGQQRVDNYAAGFIKAGAAAVIAEGHMGPAYYVRSILAGKSTIDRIWRDSPTYHGHLLRFDSLRSPGYTAQMDPTQPSSGFYRSIVLRDGLAAANTLAGATRSPIGRDLPPLEPTLAGLGMEFDAPDLAAPPNAGATTSFTFRVGASDPSAPARRDHGRGPLGLAHGSGGHRPGRARSCHTRAGSEPRSVGEPGAGSGSGSGRPRHTGSDRRGGCASRGDADRWRNLGPGHRADEARAVPARRDDPWQRRCRV